MDQFVAELRKIPPVTRFLCFSSLGVTIPVLMQMVSPYGLLFVPKLVMNKFQLWRLYTSFFLGGGGLNYIFELVMLYRTADQLESGPYARRSADLAWQLIFACASIIGLTMPLSTFVFARPLLVALAYLSSALAPPGAQTSLMGLITLPVKYFPYVMIGMDLLMGGPQAAAQAVAGAVVGHAWWWGVWGAGLGGQGVLASYSQAPEWMKKIVGEEAAPPPPPPAGRGGAGAGLAAAGVQVIPPRRPVTSPAATSTSTGYNWGSGNRLGS
ncbi:Der1-like family-domain-containing protein [Crucibulum laeve]|uniref:Derlin n=1 Tax=Crucibulum laeve TaxID=68775 RepID=A0A5C3LVK7_9AGAR|nr:Der1-like family-domain-containing protein [Crucibulum laeve]